MHRSETQLQGRLLLNSKLSTMPAALRCHTLLCDRKKRGWGPVESTPPRVLEALGSR